MANDGGMIAKLEQWFADVLAAMTNGGVKVFDTAKVWRHQVGVTEGGLEAFERYAPFAFPGFVSDEAAREGDNDLRRVLEFAILVGVTSKSDGDARTGTATDLGVSKIVDLVIAAFDQQHPGEEFTCDPVYYTSTIEALVAPKKYAVEMRFEVSYIATTS